MMPNMFCWNASRKFSGMFNEMEAMEANSMEKPVSIAPAGKETLGPSLPAEVISPQG